MNMNINKLAQAITRVIGKGHVVSFISGKGGVMKSTNAQNLAVALVDDGYKVLIVDFDPQKTSFNWSVIRKGWIAHEEKRIKEKTSELKEQQEENGVINNMFVRQVLIAAKKLKKMKNLDVIAIDPNAIDWKVFEKYKSDYDFIISDTSGHLEFIGTTKDIIKQSDIVFVPYNNSIDDFNVKMDVQKTFDNCGNYKAEVFSLVVDMNEKQHGRGIAQKMLSKVSGTMPIAPVKLFKRASWLEVKYMGWGVVEAKKDKVATQQFRDLASFVIKQINAAKAA